MPLTHKRPSLNTMQSCFDEREKMKHRRNRAFAAMALGTLIALVGCNNEESASLAGPQSAAASQAAPEPVARAEPATEPAVDPFAFEDPEAFAENFIEGWVEEEAPAMSPLAQEAAAARLAAEAQRRVAWDRTNEARAMLVMAKASTAGDDLVESAFAALARAENAYTKVTEMEADATNLETQVAVEQVGREFVMTAISGFANVSADAKVALRENYRMPTVALSPQLPSPDQFAYFTDEARLGLSNMNKHLGNLFAAAGDKVHELAAIAANDHDSLDHWACCVPQMPEMPAEQFAAQTELLSDLD